MKNYLVFILIFLAFFMSAQTYTFNHLVHYVCEVDNKSSDIITYVNTENPNIYLSVYNRHPTKKARLFDLKKGRAYNFDVEEKKVNNQIVFSFKYLSFDYVKIPSQQRFQFRFDDNGNEFQTLNIYKKDKRLNDYSVEIRTETSVKDLFSAFRFSALHPYQFNLNFKSPKMLKVKNAKLTTDNKTINYELLSDQPVVLEINIPKD